MAEIFKIMFNQKKGSILIIVFLTLGMLLFLSTYLLSFALTEIRISKSQKTVAQVYYLAEAGINEAIWKLKNDSSWASDFIDPNKNPDSGGDYWSATFTKNDVLGGSYTVTIENSDRGMGELTSVATVQLPNGKTAQRIIKTEVFKAIGTSVGPMAVFSGGTGKRDELKIGHSKVNVYNANLFSNRDVKIEKQSEVTVTDDETTEDDPETPEIENLEGQILMVHEYKKKDSTVFATEIHAENYAPASDSILMPMLDFHSTASTSYKNLAQAAEDAGQCSIIGKDSWNNIVVTSNKCVFRSSAEFEDLLWQVGQGGSLTLNNVITNNVIVYVKGTVRLRGGRILVVNNGALVAEKNIEIGKKYSWKREDITHEGNSQIIVTNDSPETKLSGLLSKGKIELGKYLQQDSSITGLLYALKDMKVKEISNPLTIQGGIVAKKIKFENIGKNSLGELNIYFKDEIIANTLGNALFSPVVSVEHWEESY